MKLSTVGFITGTIIIANYLVEAIATPYYAIPSGIAETLFSIGVITGAVIVLIGSSSNK